MKKMLFLSAVMLLGISTVAVSQTQFGARAGINIANVSGDIDDTDSRLAPFFGVFVNLSLSDQVSFQPELLYSMRGAKQSYSEYIEGYNVDVDAVWKIDYLDIPLMFKYNAGGGLNFMAGPQIGFLLSAKVDAEASAEGISMSHEEDIKDEMKGIDFDLGFGLGYDFDFGLGVDARYILGLVNVSDDSEVEVKNNAFQIGLSYKF